MWQIWVKFSVLLQAFPKGFPTFVNQHISQWQYLLYRGLSDQYKSALKDNRSPSLSNPHKEATSEVLFKILLNCLLFFSLSAVSHICL